MRRLFRNAACCWVLVCAALPCTEAQAEDVHFPHYICPVKRAASNVRPSSPLEV